jgi:ribonuclease P protein component
VPGRVRDRATFLAFRRARRRVRRGPLTVTFVPGAPTDSPRVAYAIGRRVGGAVVRNRLRRRLRAVVAELDPVLEPGAYLVGASVEAASLSFGELQAIMSELLRATAGAEGKAARERRP